MDMRSNAPLEWYVAVGDGSSDYVMELLEAIQARAKQCSANIQSGVTSYVAWRVEYTWVAELIIAKYLDGLTCELHIFVRVPGADEMRDVSEAVYKWVAQYNTSPNIIRYLSDNLIVYLATRQAPFLQEAA